MSREIETLGPETTSRSLPIGAELQTDGGTHFRVWAPESCSVGVQLKADSANADWEGEKQTFALQMEEGGYFSGFIPEAGEGCLYKFQLDSGEFPDPASRYQPFGPHSPSQIIDPRKFRWTDENWRGISPVGQVIYEMHIGTFTKEGTFRAAAIEFEELAKAGITVIELMPLAEFPGRFGWGYDGVNLFAPMHHYGTPDDLRALIDHAHQIGLGVILDAVYNHFGPDGNYLGKFSADYTTDRYANEWGEAINFDGPGSGPVREFFVTNAMYWIQEFHFDGFRFDATQQIFDASSEHILSAISRAVRKIGIGNGRSLFLAAENEDQDAKLAHPLESKGYGLNAVWNDDFHHTARVALTGRREAYYQDYEGTAQEFVNAAKWGYLYQGQWYTWQEKKRGTPAFGLNSSQFIQYLENHDQVANSLRGERLHKLSQPGAFRAVTALLLLGSATPLIFQGQEFGASTPFVYFADHHPELAKLVNEGRKKFLCQFPSIANAQAELEAVTPESEAIFLACKLNFDERSSHASHYQLYRDLLKLRKDDPVFNLPRSGGIEGAVLDQGAFVLRYFGGENGDRLLVVNLGIDRCLSPAPQPLLAAPRGQVWRLQWSSEDPAYGGSGTRIVTDGPWRIPGFTAIVLEARTMA